MTITERIWMMLQSWFSAPAYEKTLNCRYGWNSYLWLMLMFFVLPTVVAAVMQFDHLMRTAAPDVLAQIPRGEIKNGEWFSSDFQIRQIEIPIYKTTVTLILNPNLLDAKSVIKPHQIILSRDRIVLGLRPGVVPYIPYRYIGDRVLSQENLAHWRHQAFVAGLVCLVAVLPAVLMFAYYCVLVPLAFLLTLVNILSARLFKLQYGPARLYGFTVYTMTSSLMLDMGMRIFGHHLALRDFILLTLINGISMLYVVKRNLNEPKDELGQ